MDPQQRLVLMSALEALEDAGYAPDSTPSFQRDRVGVYMGVATGDYVDNLREDVDVYYSPGKISHPLTHHSFSLLFSLSLTHNSLSHLLIHSLITSHSLNRSLTHHLLTHSLI